MPRHADHDLQAILRTVCARLLYVPKEIKITWAPAESLEWGEYESWAQWRRYYEDGHWIGIRDTLQTAPRYVIEYLVFHEVLHSIFRPRGKCHHPKAFRVAERLWPTYERATAWLQAHKHWL